MRLQIVLQCGARGEFPESPGPPGGKTEKQAIVPVFKIGMAPGAAYLITFELHEVERLKLGGSGPVARFLGRFGLHRSACSNQARKA